jgi:hypothetical protein
MFCGLTEAIGACMEDRSGLCYGVNDILQSSSVRHLVLKVICGGTWKWDIRK